MDQNELKKLMNEQAGVISQTSAAAPKSAAATADANTDVGTIIRQAMAAGASASEVQSLVDRRTQKAMGTANLNQYAYDDLAKQANEYIKQQNGMANTALINQMYEQQKQTDIAAIRSAIQSGIASIQSGVQSALPQYDAMNKQSESQRYASQRALAEAMANRGDSGTAGLSGMGRGDVLSVENAGAERLGSIAMQKQQMQNDAARSIADLERSGSLQEAQAASSANQARLAALLQEHENAFTRNMQQTQFDYQQQQDTYSKQTTAQQTEYTRKLQQAETLAAYGDFSGYRALGYTDTQIGQMQSRYQAELLASQASSGKSSGGGTSKQAEYKPTLTLSQAQKLYEDGVRTDNVMNALEHWIGAGWQGREEQKANAANAQIVSEFARQIETAASMGGVSPDNEKWIARYVQQRVSSGEISKEVAVAALKKLGIYAE